jgi:hypothetical protein
MRMRTKTLLLALMGLGLSTSNYAGDLISDTVTSTENLVGNVVSVGNWHPNDYADYLLTDKDTSSQMLLDGVSDGVTVPTDSLRYDYSDTVGDHITNLNTQKSGVITGVKEQGTMDVMGHHGKVTRYQYVVFKVHH